MFGTIEQVLDNGTARVRFDSTGQLTHAIPFLARNMGQVKDTALPATGERVAVMLDDTGTDGVILGAIWTSAASPAAGTTVRRTAFPDGAVIEYDWQASRLDFSSTAGELALSAAGWEITRNGDSLGALLKDLLTQVTLQTHPVVSVGAPTGPPVNAAAYTAIIARVTAFFAP